MDDDGKRVYQISNRYFFISLSLGRYPCLHVELCFIDWNSYFIFYREE